MQTVAKGHSVEYVLLCVCHYYLAIGCIAPAADRVDVVCSVFVANGMKHTTNLRVGDNSFYRAKRMCGVRV